LSLKETMAERLNFTTALAVALVSCLLVFSAVRAETLPTNQPNGPGTVTPDTALSYYMEISIGRNLLTLYEKKGDAELTPIAEYSVGTAVRGLKTYPLGFGTVTGIYFNPWWYPTPYSRQVFRARGIELPSAVPPGDPLNYMGPFKIALSHRTNKGAIYRIHGNNNSKRVGRRVTGGCFVMDNKAGLTLAHRIKVGTEVNIVP
jgi:L,D-transpeptidase YnhG